MPHYPTRVSLFSDAVYVMSTAVCVTETAVCASSTRVNLFSDAVYVMSTAVCVTETAVNFSLYVGSIMLPLKYATPAQGCLPCLVANTLSAVSAVPGTRSSPAAAATRQRGFESDRARRSK
jgi:hypothetical protein